MNDDFVFPKLFCTRTDVLLDDLNSQALEDLKGQVFLRECEEKGLDPDIITWEQAKEIYTYIGVDLCSYALEFGLLYEHQMA